jgi:hypothetical protein
MTELEFLDRQQTLAASRIQRALLGGDGVEAPVAALERATIRRPWLAVGTAVAVGGLVGTLLGRSSGRVLIGLTRLAGRPVWHALRRCLLSS